MCVGLVILRRGEVRERRVGMYRLLYLTCHKVERHEHDSYGSWLMTCAFSFSFSFFFFGIASRNQHSINPPLLLRYDSYSKVLGSYLTLPYLMVGGVGRC